MTVSLFLGGRPTSRFRTAWFLKQALQLIWVRCEQFKPLLLLATKTVSAGIEGGESAARGAIPYQMKSKELIPLLIHE